MAANENDVVMYRGDSHNLPFTITDKNTGATIPLTGATLKLTVTTIKDPPDDTTKLFQLDAVIDDDPSTGKVVFKPTPEQTAEIGNFFYDIELRGEDQSIRTVQKAAFKIVQDNTK